MRTLACLLGALAVWVSTGDAQVSDSTKKAKDLASATNGADTVPIDSLKRNFAVPEAPAFSLLDVDSSKILRPSSVRELGVELANSAGGVGIPSALAVEFSPGMLVAGARTTIAQYASLAPLYRLRLSLGTKRDSTTKGRTQLAVGLRTSLYDASDPRTNHQVRDTIIKLLRPLEHEKNWVRDSLLEVNCVAPGQDTAKVHEQVLQVDAKAAAQPGVVACLRRAGRLESISTETVSGELRSSDTTKATYRTLFGIADSILALVHHRTDSLHRHADSVLKRVSDPSKLWNNNAVDVAVAMRGSSADSLGRGLLADDYSAWLTAALGYSKWLWWFLGAQAAADRDTTSKHRFRGSGHLATRVYAGSNAYRAYLEAQVGAAVGNRASWTFTGGGELSLGGGFWTTVGVGWAESGPGTGRVVSRLGVKAGIPGAT